MTTMPTNLAKGFEPNNVSLVTVRDHRTQVWAYQSDYKGKGRFHLREVYLGLDDNWAPTKHGFSVPVEKAAEVCRTIGAMAVPAAAA
jgi:hypothetical protein